MKTVLIAGSGGFIGNYCVKEFIGDWNVIGLHKAGYADTKDAKDAPAKTIIHDLNSPPRPVACDAIINLAAESHVDKSIAAPVPFIMNNVACALNMLEMARLARPRCFLQVSTDEVFGPAPDGTYFEEWDRQIPSSPYAASKTAQEAVAISYWRTYRIPVVIVRLMNNYGVGQNLEKMVPKTVRLLKEGKPVPVHAEYQDCMDDLTHYGVWRAGSRTWLHAANTASALRFILENVTPAMYPDADRPACFHIAGDQELANDVLVHRAAIILNVPAKIEYVDFHTSRPGHDRRYALRSTKLQELGWVPPKDFDTSFKETVLELAK
jgi:dTDP-glucose 4,6-dehydratase